MKRYFLLNYVSLFCVPSFGCFVKSAKVCPTFIDPVLPPANHGADGRSLEQLGFFIKHGAGTEKGYKNDSSFACAVASSRYDL